MVDEFQGPRLALAVSEVAKRKKVVHLFSGGTEDISGARCHRYSFQWAASPYTAAKTVVDNFMKANPKEAAQIIAEVYKMDVAVIEKAIAQTGVTVDGVPYWGPGNLQYKGMDNMIRAQKLVGAVKGDVDWSKMVDESFLPDDLKSKK